MTDDEVFAAVSAFVDENTSRDFTSWTEVTMRLPEPIRAYHLTWLVEAEVGSGGFLHFFGNYWGELGDEAVRCFERIGATRHAAVVARAVAACAQARSEAEATASLAALDDELYALATVEETEPLRRRFIEPHLPLLGR